MAEYRIEFSRRADRQLRSLRRPLQTRVAAAIETLASNPRGAGAKPLAGLQDLWRIRVGAYRIVYAIEDDVLVVLVVKIGHRREVYRDL